MTVRDQTAIFITHPSNAIKFQDKHRPDCVSSKNESLDGLLLHDKISRQVEKSALHKAQ